ncbi:MAG: cyclic nucleotide-binding domain-containing protein, partial [Magnetococcales bacterium]|nr:cyclic nucleotide-binding domain-containing protein [Magnetococcales bacterium]
VAVVKERDGNSVLLANFNAGQFFGEVSFLTGRPRTASVITLEKTITLKIGREALVHLGVDVREMLKDQVISNLLFRLDSNNAAIGHYRSFLGTSS